MKKFTQLFYIVIITVLTMGNAIAQSGSCLTPNDITVSLDANGNATITPEDVVTISPDCTIESLTVSPSSFDCADIGQQIVTITGITPSQPTGNYVSVPLQIWDAYSGNDILSGDINGDGYVDIVSNRGWYRNNSGNGFTRIDIDSYDLAGPQLGDLDGDGDLDLISANGVYHWNETSGSYQRVQTFSTNMSTSRVTSLADFDNDGDLDWYVTTYYWGDNGLERLFINDGSGNFTLGNSFAIGSYQMTSASADFDEDGKMDVVIAGYYDVYVGINDGAFTNGNPVNFNYSSVFTNGSSYIRDIKAEDFNGDGHIDLVFAGYAKIGDDMGLIMMLGNGDGTFQDGQIIETYGALTWDIDVNDFEGDGDLDIVTVVNGINSRLYNNDGAGSFTATELPFVGAYWNVMKVKLDDYNNDGIGDYAKSNEALITELAGGEETATATVTVIDDMAPGLAGYSVSYPAPEHILNNVPEAVGYNLVYALDVPNSANWDHQYQVPYTVNNTASLNGDDFGRIAYYMELNDRWVWVSADAFTDNIAHTGIPTDVTFTGYLSNMNVFSNEPSIESGTGISTGNIEFWPDCYVTGNAHGITGASNSIYDYGDVSNNSVDCYGSFQIHNAAAGDVLFAYNRWTGGGNSDIGIGSRTTSHSDWTFAGNAHTFSNKKIYVFVGDNPEILTNDITVSLDDNGQVSISAEDIDNGTTDNCGIASMTLDNSQFDCSNIGDNSVTITYTDFSGNSTSGNAIVTVVDVTAPIAVSNDIIVTLVDQNDYLLSESDLEALSNGSSDNCSYTVSYTSGVSTYNCNDVGNTYPVTFTLTDGSGNSTSAVGNVTITDPNSVCNAPPVALAQDVTANASENCDAMVLASEVDNGSYDPDGDQMTMTLSPEGPYPLGTTNVTLSVSDGEYTTTASAIVTVVDVTAPIADVTTLPDVTGECEATVVTVPTATDNCAGAIVGTTTDPLYYDQQGSYTVTWTYNDGNGNITTQTQNVIVEDVTAPVADVTTLPDVTGECDASVTIVPTATDNCAGAIVGTTTDALYYDQQGSYTVTWTYDDGNGNITTQIQNVIVEDVTSPVITAAASPITLWPPNHKYETIDVLDCFSGVSDNCSVLSDSDVIITKVTSDEEEDANGGGDGNTLNDIVIASDCKSVDLRKERQGNGNGRVYTIHMEITDDAGNAGTATYKVHVPKNKNGAVVNSGVEYEVVGNCGGNKSAIVDLNNEADDMSITAYPSPTTGNATVEIVSGQDSFTVVMIYNSFGQVVSKLYEGQMEASVTYEFEFEGSNLPAGFYFIKVQNTIGVHQTHKLMISR